MRQSSVLPLSLIALTVALAGCGKLTSLLKSEPDAAVAVDAAPPEAIDAALAPIVDASVAPVTTTKPVARKDGGHDAAVADAAVDAAVAAVADASTPAARPTRGAFTCDSPGCQCEPGVACDVTCPNVGACNVVVRELASATIHGGVGPVTIQCNKGATCHVQGGVGTTRTRCTGSKCDVECHSGACNLTCESGGKCSIAKKGVGAVKCDGC